MNTLRPVIISSFGPPALACIRSWGRKSMQPGMVAILNPGEPTPASRYLAGSTILPRLKLFTVEGLTQITDFLDSFKANGIFCIDEKVSTWLNDNSEKLPDEVALWLPSNKMTQRSLPKDNQVKTARQVGLDILPTFIFDSVSENIVIPADRFPLCLRPTVPDSVEPSFKVQNVNDDSELRNFLDSHELMAPLIGQPFKNLPNLVVHGARTVKGKTIGLQGFIVKRKFQGVTLTIQPFVLQDNFAEKCARFTDILDLVGHYHFEFLYDAASGKNFFLEFNHRFGGTTAKVLACGYDEPAYALQAYGFKMPAGPIKNCTASSIKALVKSGLYAMNGRLTPLDYPVESKIKRIFSSVKNLLTCRDEIFSWDDIKGTRALYLG